MTRRRRSYGTIRDATAYGGGVSKGKGPNFTRPAGVLAWFDGDCDRCHGLIERHVHQIVKHGDGWIHVRCASGQEDVA